MDEMELLRERAVGEAEPETAEQAALMAVHLTEEAVPEEEEELEGEALEPESETEAEAEDVEASLDEILRERLEGVGEAEGEEEGEEEQGEMIEPAGRVGLSEAEVVPCTAEEFVCRSCFLIKPRSQLADPQRLICTDCLNNH
jgi:hypothetical protein